MCDSGMQLTNVPLEEARVENGHVSLKCWHSSSEAIVLGVSLVDTVWGRGRGSKRRGF